jgi:hypothetical protein
MKTVSLTCIVMLVLSINSQVLAIPPGQGALGNKDLFQRVQQAKSNVSVLEGDPEAVLSAQRLIAEAVPCTPEGEQYQQLQLEFLDALAAANACREIVESDPTIGGVNKFLACITPVNAAIVTLAKLIGDIEFAVLTSTCTVSGNTPPVVAPHFNGLLLWAQGVGIVKSIGSLKKLLSLARDIPEIAAGVKAWPLAEGARFHLPNPSFEDALVLTKNAEVSLVLKLAQLPTAAQGTINNIIQGGGTLLQGLDSSISPLYGGPVLPPFSLPVSDPSSSSLTFQGMSATLTESSVVQATSPVFLAVAQPNAGVSLGFLPDWTTPFLQAFERARLTEAQSLRQLLGLPTPAANAPAPGVPPGIRLTPQAGILSPELAAALNTVLEQHDALAERLEQFRVLLTTTTGSPSERQALGTLAATIALLAGDEPRLRAQAVELLTPIPGDVVNAVLVAPWYLGLNVVDILDDPTLDEANQAGSEAFAAIASELGSSPSAVRGDIDRDSDVDKDDISLVVAALNTRANANDPKDLDGDGRITALDARKLTLLCTRPRCAIQ